MASVPTILGVVNLLAAESTADGAVATAEKVNNPILPTSHEFFWAAVMFVLLWILMKYLLLPPIRSIMAEREQKRLDDLAAAGHAAEQMDEAQQRYEESLAGARSEAIAKVEAARAEADAYRREVMAAAESDAAATKAESAAAVAAARTQAMASLRGGITDIALGAAEAVVERPVDRTRQGQVVEDYVNRAESSN